MKVDWGGGTVTAVWDGAPDDADRVLVLAHGAGGDMSDAILAGVAKQVGTEGTAVLRFNFPYREAGRRAPGSQTQSEDCYRSVADVARRPSATLHLGGKSYGGRMASHIVADGYNADGLVFLSYPLHAPGRSDKLRDEHLRTINVPMLFVQGTRDTFARADLLEGTLRTLPTATHAPIADGDHGLKVPRRKRSDVIDEIARAIRTFIA